MDVGDTTLPLLHWRGLKGNGMGALAIFCGMRARLLIFLSLLRMARASLALPLRLEPVRWAFDTLYAVQRSLLDQRECELGVDVEVRPAGSKGQGVFALRTIQAGELIGRYSAPVLSMDESIRATREGTTSDMYSFVLDGGNWVLDAEDAERSNWMRYINHSRRHDNIIPIPANFNGVNYAAVFQACCPIEAGDECVHTSQSATSASPSHQNAKPAAITMFPTAAPCPAL